MTRTDELYKAGWPSELYLHTSTAIAKANRDLITAMASSQLIRAMVPPNLPAVIGGGKHQFLQKNGQGNYNQLDGCPECRYAVFQDGCCISRWKSMQ